jgi:tetratricopeptide (TPR) repeat protein
MRLSIGFASLVLAQGLALALLPAHAVGLQQATPGAAPAKAACTVDRSIPSGADKALFAGDLAKAEEYYKQGLASNAKWTPSMVGLVRVLIAQGKLPDALALATKYNQENPNDPQLLDALGEVRFRRGEVDEAAMAFNAAQRIDPCLGISHYEVSRYLELSGMYAGAQRQLDLAHALSPANDEIATHWRESHAAPLSPEQRLASMKARLSEPNLTDEQKDGLNTGIKALETRQRSDCQMVTPVASAKFDILPLADGPNNVFADGLEVSFNGKKRHMEIDTGASGLLLNRAVAKAAGLVPEYRIRAGGIGDSGPTGAYVTRVDSIKIGNLEFKNCIVQVLEQKSSLDIDGLIGLDVFRDYAVTLDTPAREVRLAPLPRRATDPAPQPPALRTTGEDDLTVSEADAARDRYIAPEMKDWTQVFRYDHFLIFPTRIGNTALKLFIMDTGANVGMITPGAAREVTHVSSADSDMRVKGISGEVMKVMAADDINLAFGHVQQHIPYMYTYDSSLLSRSAGVEISGLIGYSTLKELVISIDYRDNLVNILYDPVHGIHNR